MKVVQVELPDKLAAELDGLVRDGWAISAEEVIRLALREFLRRHSTALAEQFIREDIAWALRQKEAEHN